MQVGAFVLLALFLGLGMVLFFSTTTIFASTQTYIVYFEDSVKGLSVGASVKYKGVPIGLVKKIYVSYNQPANSARIPVLIEIDSEQLSQLANLRRVSVNDVIQREIDNGLRAQLELESFITGMLFVDLDYHNDADAPQYLQQSKIYREIPSIRSPFSELGNSANDIIARLSDIDFGGLSDEVKGLASTLNRSLSAVDFAKLSTSITDGMESVKGASDNFAALSSELNAAIRGESTAGVQLQTLSKNLSDASASISRLADYLERHPNALLTGRPSNE